MQNTLLNLTPGAYSPEVHLSQYDKGRTIPFKLMDGNAEYTVPSGAVIKVKATKPSGLGFVVDCTYDGGTVTITNTETMSNEAGRFPAELSISVGDVLLGTANFIFNVERSPHPEGTTDGDAETLIPELTLLVNEARSLVEQAEETAQTVTGLEPRVSANENAINVLDARMDTFASLPDGSTSGDAELVDIRVGVDGAIFSSAGDAVRGQVQGIINGKIDDSIVLVGNDFENGYWEANSIKSDWNARARNKIAIKVSAGQKLVLSNGGGQECDFAYKIYADKPDGTTVMTALDSSAWVRAGEYDINYDGYLTVNFKYVVGGSIDISSFVATVTVPNIITLAFPWLSLNDGIDSTIKGLFVEHMTHLGNGTYGTHQNRNAIIHPIKFPYSVNVSVNGSIYFAYQFYSSENNSAETLTEASAWLTSATIPANQWFCMIVCNEDNSATDQSTTNALVFSADSSALLKEIEDARISNDGISYNTLGDHIRAIEGNDLTNYVIGADLIKRPLKVELVGTLTYHQAFCKWDDKYYSIDGNNIAEQDSDFNVLRNVALNTGHGNSLQMGISHYAFASGWDDNKVYVIDINTLAVTGTINLPTTGYTTVAIDELNDIAYIFQRDSYPSTEARYNFIVYDYVNEQIISTKQTKAFGAMQACDFFDDKIIVLNGMGTSALPNGYRVYDTNGNILAEYVLGDFSNAEPEGVCLYDDTHELYISLVNKGIYKVY